MRTAVVTALAAVLLVGGMARADDWPMWGRDPARTGRTSVELSDELHPQWVRQLPAPRRAWRMQLDDKDKLEFDLSYSIIVSGDTVFAPSMTTDRLTAYDLDSGTERWRRYVDGPVRLAPAAWEGNVYVVSDDGHLYCFDADSGERRWRFDGRPAGHRVLGNERIISMWPARGGPVVHEGTVYFASGIWPYLGTFIYALDARTGEQVWANTGHSTEWQRQPHGGAYAFAGVAPQGYLAVSGDRLVVSGGRALPALFNRRDGTVLHTRVDGKDIGGYRVRIDGDHYYNHGLRFRLEDGQRDGGGEVVDEALRARVDALRDQLDDEVFEYLAARGRLLVVTRAGTIYCFGPDERETTVHAYQPDAPPVRMNDPGLRAEEILRESGTRSGYALFLGVGNGDLIEQMAVRSDLHIIGIDPAAERIAALRRRFDDAGLYGSRIALLADNPAAAAYPKYISSLIVMEHPAVLGGEPDAQLLEKVYDWLRPYDGRAFLGTSPATREAFAAAVGDFVPAHGDAGMADGYVTLARTGPLPGSGQWTHQYADSANTVISHDDLVRPPFGPIWFGGPTHDNILPRHAAGPRPQVAGGRLVVLGVETLSARCVFTGREMWVREFPGIGHPFTDLALEQRWLEGVSVYMTNQPGASYIGSPYVTLPDSIYVRYQGRVFRLDPQTGRTLAEWPLPARPSEREAPDWGHISVCDDTLLVTTNPHIWRGGALGTWGDDSWDGSSSERLIALDRHTGEVLWVRDAEIGFRHLAIASHGDRVFVNDLLSEQALAMAGRRGMEVSDRPRLYALDLRTGDTLWTSESDVFGTFLSYSAEHDILIEGGSRDSRRHVEDEPRALVARWAYTGEVLWEHDGAIVEGPLIIHGDTLISGRPGPAICLLSGEVKQREHPISGDEDEWSYWKAYGCGMSNAGTHLLLFRSGAAGFADLEHDGGTGTIGGAKSGCTASLIPADGILNAPDYTRTCTCSYQNQTSQGLIHMPEMELWTVNQPIRRVEGSIERLGVNLGAPGDRKADNGTLWTPFPRAGTPGPELRLLLSGLDAQDVPARIVAVDSRPAAAERRNVPENSLDGDPSTQWDTWSNHQGQFNAWLRYELSEPVMLDRMEVAWTGPQATQFRIETSLDGEQWTVAFEEEGQGHDGEMGLYRFEPVRARLVRLAFGGHGDTRTDSQGRILGRTVAVSRVKIGELAYPDAYAYFIPKDVFRKNALFVDGADGLNWVAASGVRGIRRLELLDVNGGDQPYTVNLHFADPDESEPGQRWFDIYIQGDAVAREFDVARAAGGANRATVRSFPNVRIGGSLRIEFTSASGSRPPVLSGVELRKEK